MQEFIAFSDYHDGRDIFEVANIMTIIRLAMYWTHRGVDALACIEKTRLLPVKAYANILKAGWILQRLQMDQRFRSEECTAIIISLSEVGAIPVFISASDDSQMLIMPGDRTWFLN